MRTTSQLLQKLEGRSRAAEGNLLAPLDFRHDSRATRSHERVVERDACRTSFARWDRKGRQKKKPLLEWWVGG